MESRVSTAFSDLILAVSAFYSYQKLSSVTEIDYQFSNWWFMLQMIAAGLGVIKFGRYGGRYHDKIEIYHKNFSWLTQTVGIPCLGAQFCFLYGFSTLSQIFLVSAVASFVICFKKPHFKDSVPMFVSGAVILILMFFGFKEKNTNLCYSVGLMIISTVIGTKDDFVILSLPATDIFHYLLALSNMFTVKALLYI